VMAFLSAALTVGGLTAAATLVTTGQLLGWSPGLPLWASLLILLVAMLVVGRPLGHFREALHRAPYPGGVAWLAAWDGILWLGFMAVLGWLAWQHSPEVRALAHDLPGSWEKLRASWQPGR
jgi:hypothetical protein